MLSKHEQVDQLLEIVDYCQVQHGCVLASFFRQENNSWAASFCIDDGRKVSPDKKEDLCIPTSKLKSVLEAIGFPVVLHRTAWLDCDIGVLSCEHLQRTAEALSGNQSEFWHAPHPLSPLQDDKVRGNDTNPADFLFGLLDACSIKHGEVDIGCSRQSEGQWELSFINWRTKNVSGRDITRPLGASQRLHALIRSIGLSGTIDPTQRSTLFCQVEMISADLLQQITTLLQKHDQDEFSFDPDPSAWTKFVPSDSNNK